MDADPPAQGVKFARRTTLRYAGSSHTINALRVLHGRLLRLGLWPDHTCVYYGCGTLRVGQHVIQYLGPRRYWGFEIDDEYLNVGNSLLSDSDIAQKQPHLRVISASAVAEQQRPDLLFSHKVMQHVHPDELSEYLSNIVEIIRPGKGQAFILNSKWREAEMVRYKPMGWAHNFSLVRVLIMARGAEVEVFRN